jgi:hypothetical protein
MEGKRSRSSSPLIARTLRERPHQPLQIPGGMAPATPFRARHQSGSHDDAVGDGRDAAASRGVAIPNPTAIGGRAPSLRPARSPRRAPAGRSRRDRPRASLLPVVPFLETT